MNYTYDIHLNLNNMLYDFFDWNKNDKVMHIKKIPIFKTNEKKFRKLVNCNVKMNEEFLNYVHNKTELWNIKDNIAFCALFCDDNNIIAIQFNENGNSLKKSSLLVDEELEILETINRINEKEVEFEIISENLNLLKTRNELNEERFVNNELKNIESSKLSYIYFECFGKHEKNKNNILKSIKKLSKNSNAYKNLYNILKLTSTSKNKML